jgi:hypothetical protein
MRSMNGVCAADVFTGMPCSVLLVGIPVTVLFSWMTVIIFLDLIHVCLVKNHSQNQFVQQGILIRTSCSNSRGILFHSTTMISPLRVGSSARASDTGPSGERSSIVRE